MGQKEQDSIEAEISGELGLIKNQEEAKRRDGEDERGRGVGGGRESRIKRRI